MKRHLEFLDKFSDKFLQSDFGKGTLLSGVVLGFVAYNQTKGEKGESGYSNAKIQDSPLYKQLNFGRLSLRDIKKHLSRLPELIKAYKIEPSFLVEDLAGYSQELLLNSKGKDLGIDGNFAFVTGFMNWRNYFREIYKDYTKEKEVVELEIEKTDKGEDQDV
jgi:hypothetical protein